jgi:predicted transcriptional regulator
MRIRFRQAILLFASRFFRMMKGMEVRFDPHLQGRLLQRANQQGRQPEEFVQDVVARYLDDEDRFAEAVKRGEEALVRGEYLTHEQVVGRLHRFLHTSWKSVGRCQPPKTSSAFASTSNVTTREPPHE